MVDMTKHGGTSGAGTGDHGPDGHEPAVVLGVGDIPLDADHPAVRFTCDEVGDADSRFA